MRRLSFYLILVLALGLVLTACQKQPTEDINATKAALDAAVSEGAQKYTPDDYKAVSDQLNAAMDEVKVQDEKFFKNYDKAKEMLTKVKSDSDALKSKVAVVKEEMKNKAIADLEAAKTAVADAQTELKGAPRGKGTAADIEAMKADMAGLEEAINEVQPLIDSGEYQAATEKATSIKDRATQIAEDIKAAKAAKKGKR